MILIGYSICPHRTSQEERASTEVLNALVLRHLQDRRITASAPILQFKVDSSEIPTDFTKVLVLT